MTTPDAPTPWQTETPAPSSRLLPPQLVFSDTPSRVMAYVLDGVAIAPLLYVIFGLLGVDFYTFNPGHFPDRNVYVFASLGLLLVNAVYFTFFWSGGRRATPAQRLFGIQVANAFDGKPLTVGQAFGRWAAMGQWLGFGFVLPIFSAAVASGLVAAVWSLVLLVSTVVSPTKQGLHDRFAGAAVARPAGASNRWAVGCLTLLIIGTVLETLLVVWVFAIAPPPNLPPDYWDRYTRWLWPS